MKHYNINNYIRYKNDVDVTIKRIGKKEFDLDWELTPFKHKWVSRIAVNQIEKKRLL